jgi:23S rRNA (pseudouridine1915-N3)-methyltransferase
MFEKDAFMSLEISIVAIGKKNSVLDDEIGRYLKLLGPFVKVSVNFIKPLQMTQNQDKEKIAREGKILQEKWPPGSYPVALSEEGRTMNSVKFSQWLEGLSEREKRVTFTIGGAYGLSSGLKQQCKETLSLSPMTLPHKLCMLVLIEQIYRAFTILKHHPYHK